MPYGSNSYPNLKVKSLSNYIFAEEASPFAAKLLPLPFRFFEEKVTRRNRWLLSNINRAEDSKTVEHYKRKFCPKARWCCFHGCCMYFHPSAQALNSDAKVLTELALRRMKLEVSNGGGKSYSLEEACFLHKRSLHVVWSQWLQDCLDNEDKVQEETYSLKPVGLEGSNSGEWAC
ncbi:hypothetical protein Vadar_026175 [Vaccinium darrowii]|uniref:Uncharacterized protein n=1 Tax=Vaccinium darrowii TaxID=229202 RepID=A0ACB7X412_9ERIC|nr:hypothetical protein Vadar_026175 [Vaccinium darrowii]